VQKIKVRTNSFRMGSGDESGTSVVEFALVFPIFILLLLGLLQYGMIFLVRNQMTESASDAARSAVTYTSQSVAISTVESSLNSDVAHDGVGLVSASNGCGTWPTTPPQPGTSVTSTANGITCTINPVLPGQPGCENAPPAGYECLQVEVSYDYAHHPILPLPFIPTPSTVKASSTVIVGNGALSQ
jgi:hypothetical protein